MERTIRLTIKEFPPSLNHCYTHNQYGAKFLTAVGRAWQTMAGWEIKAQGKGVAFDKIRLGLNFYFPDMRSRDVSNYLKLLEDAVKESGLIPDDNWKHLEYSHIKGSCDKDNPRIELVIVGSSPSPAGRK